MAQCCKYVVRRDSFNLDLFLGPPYKDCSSNSSFDKQTSSWVCAALRTGLPHEQQSKFEEHFTDLKNLAEQKCDSGKRSHSNDSATACNQDSKPNTGP